MSQPDSNFPAHSGGAARSAPPPPATATDGALPRRPFLVKFAALAIGAIVALVPLGISLFAMLDPVRRKTSKGSGEPSDGAGSDQGGFFRVANLAALPADGVPRFFRIIADRDDAWTHFANEPVGSLYLVRGKDDSIKAYNATCPHLGCLVGFVAAKDEFLCPCHNSYFDLHGARSGESPSPRDLDEMQAEIRDGAVWVKYHDFRTGTAQQIPVA